MTKKKEFKKGSCNSCENYDKESKECDVGKNCKTNFGKCEGYVINRKLIHFKERRRKADE